jgi:L-threonate 2-dehydrogenase
VHRLGDAAGPGSAMKAVNQLLAGLHIMAMGEALALATTQGLDLSRVAEVIRVSAGTSWMFENRAPHVIEGDYAPRSAIDIWPKDLGIVAEMARRRRAAPAAAGDRAGRIPRGARRRGSGGTTRSSRATSRAARG